MKKLILIASILLLTSMNLFTSCRSYTEHPKKENITVVDDSSNVVIETAYIVTYKELKDKVLYKKNCKFCHGEDGKGDGIKARVNPDICPFDLSKVNKPDKYIYYVILKGKEKMPNHQKLNDTDVNILVVYIKKFKDKE